MEEGRIHKAVPKDQADYLKSDPGTPNIQETSAGPCSEYTRN
jgi:hypothetical protein